MVANGLLRAREKPQVTFQSEGKESCGPVMHTILPAPEKKSYTENTCRSAIFPALLNNLFKTRFYDTLTIKEDCEKYI